MNRVLQRWGLRGDRWSGDIGYDSIAQQALSIAQQALTVITEHKEYCETANKERMRLDIERDNKVQALHDVNVRQREAESEAAKKRWWWLITAQTGIIVTLAIFIIENWHSK